MSLGLFGRHVVRCACGDRDGLAAPHCPRDTEVGEQQPLGPQIGATRAVMIGDRSVQDVRRFEVSVHDAECVRDRQTLGNVA